jgi:hypothetical protein
MLAVLVGVSGWVLRGLMMTWHRMQQGSGNSDKLAEMDERLRKIESATTSLLVDVTSIREKQRFMARLQAGPEQREAPRAEGRSETGVSPMMTQSIPIIPRAGRG